MIIFLNIVLSGGLIKYIKKTFDITTENGNFECGFCDMFDMVLAFTDGSTKSVEELFNLIQPEKIILNAGKNYLDVGPWFDEIGDVDNYKFQDCSSIYAERVGVTNYSFVKEPISLKAIGAHLSRVSFKANHLSYIKKWASVIGWK